jgi:D-tyrosyl-tRNA(Tyr) deacylase
VRAVVQRVERANVLVDDAVVGSIRHGLVVLLGVAAGDEQADADAVAAKLQGLRVFSDEDGKMNRSVVEAGGAVLVVSQFTLLGDVRKGRRPSFTGAADPAVATGLVDRVIGQLEAAGVPCASGSFGSHMKVELVNDGPVTIILETAGGRIV